MFVCLFGGFFGFFFSFHLVPAHGNLSGEYSIVHNSQYKAYKMFLGDKGLFIKRVVVYFAFFLWIIRLFFKCGHAKEVDKAPIFKHIVANIRDFFWLG